MKRSIVLLSGGLDSVVSFDVACRESEVVAALTFNYGQRAAQKEISVAESFCRDRNVKHVVIELSWLADITETALVNTGRDLPNLTNSSLIKESSSQDTAQAVWVPNRNGVFLNIAAAYAEAWKIDQIVTGFNAEEAATFPDNSPEYVRACMDSFRYSTRNHVSIWIPTLHLDKSGIIRLARELDTPVEKVWPCYEGGESLCWKCESCVRFKRGLQQTGNWEWYQERVKQGGNNHG